MLARRIFVSATTRGLGSYRRLASESLRKRGYQADDQAIFELTYHEIATMLEQRISRCDAVLCLIGFAYGAEPSERPEGVPRRSYTQWEFFIARKLGKPVYRLVADKTTPLDPHDPEPDELRQLQLAYREEVTRDRDWRPFASADQLRAELAELRFPWEGPPPDHKPKNLPFQSLGKLFKGRDKFLDDLRAQLAMPGGHATAIVACQAVHGLGGVGKTRAALEYAWRHADDYTALLFVSAPSPGELRANLANLAGVLAVDSIGTGRAVDEQMAEALNWLDAHPGWLLILDNVDTDAAAREVEDLLARLRSGHVLITSRIAHWSAAVEPLELHVLTSADAVAFLLERARSRRKKPDDANVAATIARELDGLALALEQAGAYIETQRLSLAEYLDRWQAKRPEVLRWHDQRLMKYPASVAVTWETTFELLDEAERCLLGVLSWLSPEPIPLVLLEAESLTGAIPDPRAALAGLAEYSLVRFEDAADGVLVHRLVQEITRIRTDESERAARLTIALDAVNVLVPFDANDVRTWPVWTPLAPHAATVTRHAEAAGITTPTARLLNQLSVYLLHRSQYREAEPMMRRALAIDEHSYGPDHPNVAIRLNNLASLLQATNRLGQAEPMMRRALAIDEHSYGPDHPNVSIRLGNLAWLLREMNRLAETEPLLRRALAIAEHSYEPDHPNVAIQLRNLAWLLRETNRLAEAEPLMRRALAISEHSCRPDHPNVAIQLNTQVQLFGDTNRLGDAEPLMRRALVIDEHSYGPDHPYVACDLYKLAKLLRDTNRLAEAEPIMRRALAIHETAYGPDHPRVALDLNRLATLLRATHRLEEAERLTLQALEILRHFRETTGHEHLRWRVVLQDYQKLLEAMEMSAEEIARRLGEVAGG